MKVSHFVPFDAPGRRIALALCGRHVDPRRDHALDPTCPICAAQQAAIEAMPDPFTAPDPLVERQ